MIKKILILLAILIVLAISVVIWGVFSIRKSYKLMEQGTVQSFKGIVGIPFTYSNSGHMIVSLQFGDDTTSYPFLFDTGASNMLFEHFPHIEKMDKVGKSVSKGSGGHFMLNEIRRSSTVQFGGVDFKNLCFEVASFDWTCWNNVYGIFGKEAMRHLSWQIDFDKQVIYFSENIDNLNISEEAYKIPLGKNKYSHHLYLGLNSTQNQKRLFLFDTGYNGGLSLQKEYDSFEKSISDSILILGKLSKGIGGYSKTSEQMVRMDTLYVNEGLFIKNVWAKHSESAMNAVGLDLLSQFLISFNWDDEMLYLVQISDSLNLNEKKYGFTSQYNDGEVIISSVLECSDAYKKGIRPKQKLIRINDHNISSEQAYCKFSISKHDSVQITLLDKANNEFQVMCFKENLDLIND